jgi:NAD(P)H-dependent FMN reductase
MALPALSIVIASTRPGRVGRTVGDWFVERARQHAGFDVTVVDLAEVRLPFLDEPEHPRFRRYQHEHTKKWSAAVDAADAFVFVTPEYDYSMPATLLNAVQFLSVEWHYKACGFVSYGGVSGGTRSVQMAKQVITAVKMMPIPEAVSIPFVAAALKDGVYPGAKTQDDAASAMLGELLRWTSALAVLRKPKPR